MVTVAIVDDEIAIRNELREYVKKYLEKIGESYKISDYSDGMQLVESGKMYDIIFLDIQMSGLDGMTTAKEIREYDKSGVIVFVTNLVQYAIEGYRVDAADYILKPVQYNAFETRMNRIIQKVTRRKAEITVVDKYTKKRIRIENIRYVETNKHKVIYHCPDVEYEAYETMSSVEDKLKDYGFCRCNSCYLVNVNFIEKIEGDKVYIGDNILEMSRGKKKSFLDFCTNYK